MGYSIVGLPSLIPSSSASGKTIGLGQLDDAETITLFLASSASANSTAATIQVAPFDPTLPFLQQQGVSSSGWVTLSTDSFSGVTSSASQWLIKNTGFKGLRLSLTTSNANEIIAYVQKRIFV